MKAKLRQGRTLSIAADKNLANLSNTFNMDSKIINVSLEEHRQRSQEISDSLEPLMQLSYFSRTQKLIFKTMKLNQQLETMQSEINQQKLESLKVFQRIDVQSQEINKIQND